VDGELFRRLVLGADDEEVVADELPAPGLEGALYEDVDVVQQLLGHPPGFYHGQGGMGRRRRCPAHDVLRRGVATVVRSAEGAGFDGGYSEFLAVLLDLLQTDGPSSEGEDRLLACSIATGLGPQDFHDLSPLQILCEPPLC